MQSILSHACYTRTKLDVMPTEMGVPLSSSTYALLTRGWPGLSNPRCCETMACPAGQIWIYGQLLGCRTANAAQPRTSAQRQGRKGRGGWAVAIYVRRPNSESQGLEGDCGPARLLESSEAGRCGGHESGASARHHRVNNEVSALHGHPRPSADCYIPRTFAPPFLSGFTILFINVGGKPSYQTCTIEP